MALKATIAVSILGWLTSVLDMETGKSEFNINALTTFTDGDADDKASKIFSDERTLSASASEELDLSGSLTDIYGNTLTLTKVKAILVIADDGNTNDVQVGGSASNGFDAWIGAAGDYVSVKPGGCMLIVAPKSAGYAVTAGTGDLLKIANSSSGTGVTYKIVIIGVE